MKMKASENGIIVKGIDNCLVRIAHCCNPVPGDAIVGYITRGRGVSVHRADCVNMADRNIGEDRIIEVRWNTVENASYLADLNLLANDRTSLIMDISNTIGEDKIPLKGINARTTREQIAIIDISLEITNTQQLDKIIKKLKRIVGVFQVTRKKR
jgi:guanosine-3',5'-bis(diphosphate) 3'-pyrophosphohydrolase